jgi:stress-induced morphogen
MKTNLFLIIFILSITSCAQKELKKDTIVNEPKKEITIISENVSEGWSDKDTYTVKIVSENLEKAKDKARHKILQDIVKVRMMNESRFTDISKINSEFDKPLKNGKVISEKQIDNGIEIYYQIRDDGLKEKFEKQ